MKTTLLTFALTTVSLATGFAQGIKPPAPVPTENKPTPEALKKEMSYGLGFQNGEHFASYGFTATDFDQAAYIKGLIAALSKKDLDVDPKLYDQAMKSIDKIIHNRELALAKSNLAKGAAFMEKNAKRKEITTTASGLQYEVLKKGTGKVYAPPAGTINGMDNITEFYIICKGTLLDGTVFTETPKNEPIAFNLQVIHGFAEALKMMPTGSKWKIYVPAKLGFGQQRQGAKIEPNSMLTYEIELAEIKVRLPDPSPKHPGGAHPAPGAPKLPR